MPADGLTVTLSAGSTLFDDRYGLAAGKPLKLKPMTTFPNDSPEAAWLHGDLLVQLCANHPDTIHHAIRDIAKHTRGGMQLRWKIEGYNSPPRPSGTGRNLLGFKDGTANPAGTLASDLVWVDDPAEPAWARNGSYLVVRLIRMLVEFWDRVSINEQEGMFGRRRDTGAPLDGTSEFDTPNYKADPHGSVIPLDSHIRLANPRTPQTANQRLIRRSYNYDLGMDLNGNLQAGHIFIAYQQDVERQFETVQRRLDQRAPGGLRAAVRRRLLLHPPRRPRRQRLVRQGPARVTAGRRAPPRVRAGTCSRAPNGACSACRARAPGDVLRPPPAADREIERERKRKGAAFRARP